MHPDAQKTGTLDVHAARGVGFRVLDVNGSVVGSGAGSRRLELGAGIYSVEWRSGANFSETLVRVVPGRSAEAVSQLKDIGEALGITTLVAESPKIVAALKLARNRQETSIVVVADLGLDSESQTALESVRVLDTSRSEVPASDVSLDGEEMQANWRARRHCVEPGVYTASYESLTGERMEQSVPALLGRQTFVFFQIFRGRRLISKGSGFTGVEQVGIDPSRTLMMSVVGDETSERIGERLRLTTLLMEDLADGAVALTEEFCKTLDKTDIDPLLKMLGAIVVLKRIERKVPIQVDTHEENNNYWLERVKTWLQATEKTEMPADAVAAWWQIGVLSGSLDHSDVLWKIGSLPMFVESWRWIAAQSVTAVEMLPRSLTVLAAERSGIDCEPWFCWKPASATAARHNSANDEAINLEVLASDVADKTKKALEYFSASLVKKLGPANTALMMFLGNSLGPVTLDTIKQLAARLGMPLDSLRSQLVSAKEALESYKPDGRGSNVGAVSKPSQLRIAPQAVPYADVSVISGRPAMIKKKRRPAPGLRRPIHYPDDPHKGRFGEKSSHSGFRVTATFKADKSKDWTSIRLRVEGPADDDDPVRFYLHDSFEPDVEVAKFNDGHAELKVTAWGGFTVGLWLPIQQVELELDLAEVPGAPQNIRTE
ncbi:MAG: pYEATS domain-containing protein [Rhodospirillales bacterium]